MFALRAPLPVPRVPTTYKRRKVSRVCRSYFTIDEQNTTLLSEDTDHDLLHIITFHQPNEEEGIYAVRKLNSGGLPENCIVAWRNFDDAFRYKTLLDAEMKRSSYIQFASHYELDFALFSCLIFFFSESVSLSFIVLSIAIYMYIILNL